MNSSPSFGARPPGMKTSLKPGLSWKARTDRFQSEAMTGESGKPSSAYLIAAARTSFIGSFPYRAWRSNHAAAVPGTDQE